MLGRITRLRYWKSEHTAETCQDQLGDDLTRGLFVVADGVGTTTFPRLWADVLVKHYLAVPLMSEYPFETEWWVREAQESYLSIRPKLEALSFPAREKESSQGSESTLAAARLISVGELSARAELIAFGDSCIFVGRPSLEQVSFFPVEKAADFDRRPICLPSHAGVFSRRFHRGKRLEIEVLAGDTLLLATDAVARWIVSRGDGRKQTVWEAFQEVIQRRPGGDWEEFIERERQAKALLDDDSTALIVELRADAAVSSADVGKGDHQFRYLGVTTQHAGVVIQQRKRHFEQARQDRQLELQAIFFGDGADLGGLLGDALSQAEIDHAREVADALRAVIAASTAFYKKPEFVSKMREIWKQHQSLLEDEPCAAGIRTTLKAHGVLDALSLEEDAAPNASPFASASGNFTSQRGESPEQTGLRQESQTLTHPQPDDTEAPGTGLGQQQRGDRASWRADDDRTLQQERGKFFGFDLSS